MSEKLDPPGKDIGQQEEEILAAGLANPGDEEETESEVTKVRMGEDHTRTAIVLSKESSLSASMVGVAATMAEGYSKEQDLESLPEEPETSFNEEPGEGMGGVASKIWEG